MKLMQIVKALFLRQLRDGAYMVWVLVLPQLLYFLLRIIWPQTAEGGALIGALTLFLALTTGFVNQPLVYTQMRDDGMLDRLRVSPLSPLAAPLGSLLAAFLLSLIGLVMLLAIGILFGDIMIGSVGCSIASALIVLGACLAAGFPLSFYIRDFMTLKNAASLFMFILFAASGAFFKLPGPWQLVHTINPAYWFYQALLLDRTDNTISPELLVSAAAMAGLGIVLAGIGARRRSQ